jgi:hypothetical protein
MNTYTEKALKQSRDVKGHPRSIYCKNNAWRWWSFFRWRICCPLRILSRGQNGQCSVLQCVKEHLLKKNEISEASPVPFKRLVIVIQCTVLWSYDWKPFLDNRKVAVLQYPPYTPAHTPINN